MTEPIEPVAESTPGAEIVQFRSRNSLTSKVNYAKELAQSGLLPEAYRRQPANVLYAVEFGEMLGISPMAAIVGVHIIEGKPSAGAALMSALVRAAGHRLRVKFDAVSMIAVAELTRKDDRDFTFTATWTLDRAVTAGLCEIKNGKPWARTKNGKPSNWEKYPVNMLKARAIAEVCRDGCEEVLSGVHYTPEELGAEVDEEGNPLGRTVVEQVDPPKPKVDWDAEIEACGADRDKFVALWKRANASGDAEALAKVNAAGLRLFPKPKEESAAAESEPVEPPAAAPEPEVVDAEIVEDVEDDSNPSSLFDRLLGASTADAVEDISGKINTQPKIARMDITGFLYDPNNVKREHPAVVHLQIPRGERLNLGQLAAHVADYVAVWKRSVNESIRLAAEERAKKAS